jgi:hypothetical protein
MTYKDLGVVIRNVGMAAQQAQKEAVFRAAIYMKDTITNEIHGDLGGKDYFSRMEQKKTKSGKFVGVRPATNRVGVRFDVKGTYNPTALLVAYGPAGLLEYGAHGHMISAKNASLVQMRGGRSKSKLMKERNLKIAFGERGAYSGSTPLRTPYGPRFNVTLAKGARGKKSISRGYEKSVPRATNLATTLIQSKVIQQLRTQFGTFTYLKGEEGAFRPVVG